MSAFMVYSSGRAARGSNELVVWAERLTQLAVRSSSTLGTTIAFSCNTNDSGDINYFSYAISWPRFDHTLYFHIFETPLPILRLMGLEFYLLRNRALALAVVRLCQRK